MVAALVTVAAVAVALAATDVRTLRLAVAGLIGDPVVLAGGSALYGLGFLVRSWAWSRLVPGLGVGHAWAAVHVSLLGNHVLPLRLGEPLRVLSAVRRAGVGVGAATASTVTLRSADVVALLGLAAGAGAWVLHDAPAAVRPPGGAVWPVVALATAGLLLLAGGLVGIRLVRRGAARRGAGAPVRWPGAVTVAAVLAGWVLEAGIVWAVGHAAGVDVGLGEAVLVSSAAVLAQVAAVAPGGFGTYEAGAVVAWALVGVDPGTGLALALVTHGVGTLYAVVAGLVALVVPSPGEFGRWRLPSPVPAPWAPVDNPAPPPPGAPVVLVLPAHDEAATVAAVVARVPAAVAGRPVHVLVVDDGSADATAEEANAAGAEVVRHPVNRGLGAAVRTGFARALELAPAAVAFCDADGEYAPEELGSVVGPVLEGRADYVVGSRFAGRIHRMHPHRRLGNRVLTAWVRWTARRRDLTDGQSGYRALSLPAVRDAEIVHDYNYAQVLTLDLLGKGYRYAEVPISYRFRRTGRSFVRLGRYLSRVVPAVHRELNADPEVPRVATGAPS
ncbi:MAG: lysylphosphatidylglycerol synthase domain-containing protein [Kineosporiaceae bacterium]